MPSVRIERLIKEFSWVLAGQVLAMLGSLVLLRVLTENLDPSQFGQFALSLTIVGLINILVMGGVVNGIGRYYSVANDQNDVPGYLRASFIILSYASAIILVVSLTATGVLVWLDYSQWIGHLIAVVAVSILGGFNAALNSIQNAERKRSIVALHISLDSFLKVLFVIGTALWFDISVTSTIACFALASLVVLISQFFFLQRSHHLRNIVSIVSPKQDWVKKILIFSGPIMIMGVFGWAQSISTRWALQAFGSNADVGYYSVLSQIGYVPIHTLMGIFMTFLTPIIYEMAGDAKNISRRKSVSSLTNRIFLSGIIITSVITLFAFFFHHQILSIFVAKEYLIISRYLPIMIASGGTFGIGLVISAKHLSFLSAKQLMPASIGSAIIGIVAAFAGVYFYSFEGAVFAMLVHSVSYLIMVLMVSSALEVKNETN
tara:strand:- start:18 stop:1313 length:1296 start_codon:yes stop_codon:yes gene_type:complete